VDETFFVYKGQIKEKKAVVRLYKKKYVVIVLAFFHFHHNQRLRAKKKLSTRISTKVKIWRISYGREMPFLFISSCYNMVRNFFKSMRFFFVSFNYFQS